MVNREKFKYLDLEAHYDNDGISFYDNRIDGDFDGRGMTFPGEELPESDEVFSSHNITFKFPNKVDGKPNNFALSNQKIRVKNEHYSRIFLLGTSEYGSFEDQIELSFSDGKTIEYGFGFTHLRKCLDQPVKPLYRNLLAIKCSRMHYPDKAIDLPCGLWICCVDINCDKGLEYIEFGDNSLLHVFSISLQN